LNIASIFEAQGDVIKSLEYNQRALDLCSQLEKSTFIAIANNNLANNYKDLGDIDQSAYHYFQAQTIYDKEENAWGAVGSLNNLALLYINDKNFEPAEEYLTEALEKTQSIGFVEGEAMTYANIGVLRTEQRDFEAAVIALKECLRIVEENGMAIRVPYAQLELGGLYLNMKDYQGAEKYINEGLANSEKYGVEEFIILGLFHKCRLLVGQKQWQAAETYGKKGYERSIRSKDLSYQVDFTQQLVTIYKNLGRSADALQMFEKQVVLKDSLLNEETSRNLIQQGYQYTYERKSYQDSLANAAALEIQAADLQRRKLTNWFLIGILLIIGVFALVLINRYRIIQDQKKRIQEEKDKTQAEKIKAEEANAKLLEIDQSKSRFFTNISHEFRTPLTVISGMAEQIKEGDQVKKLIKRNTSYLLQLINQILDLRKLESGNLPTRFIQSDVVKYLRYVMESFQSLAEDKNINLHFKSSVESLVLDYDPEKLLRIVSNLLSNAIKFSAPGKDITLSVETKQEGDKPSYQFEVSDEGIGIPKEKLPYVFDRFYQIDNSTTRVGEGTGIGLALSKELVELLNGTINVKSEEGNGTTFIVALPHTQEAILEDNTIDTAVITPQLSESIPAKSRRIDTKLGDENLPSLLIVEDNPDVMEYLITCLDGQYQLSFASDGQYGLEKALEQVPDIIISDVMMPRMDGFTLCNELKTDERTSHIPIILLTAKADIESRITGLERGADAYLAKPFDKRELNAQLENLLTLRQRLQARYASFEKLEPTEEIAIQKEDEFITKLRTTFEARLDDPSFDITALSKEMLLSASQLRRKVKALTGRKLTIYLRSLRLAKAKTLLLTTDLSVKEVAYDVGFANPGYFSNSYNEEFGEYPTVTREAQ
jgi:signal transduction histidine kinase/DNA-binding response OmpR family regulator